MRSLFSKIMQTGACPTLSSRMLLGMGMDKLGDLLGSRAYSSTPGSDEPVSSPPSPSPPPQLTGGAVKTIKLCDVDADTGVSKLYDLRFKGDAEFERFCAGGIMGLVDVNKPTAVVRDFEHVRNGGAYVVFAGALQASIARRELGSLERGREDELGHAS